MRFQEVHPKQTLLVDLAYDEPLAAELSALVEAVDVETAWFLGSGAVREAELAMYDQDEYAFETVSYAEPLEMPMFTGSVVTTDESPDVLVRGVLARPSGQALAGVISEATVFGGEALVWGFEESIGRETDSATGMDRFAR